MQQCAFCGARTYGVIEPTHTYNAEPDAIVAPSCDEAGGKVWYCTVCNPQQDPELDGVKCETVPAAHSYNEEVKYVAASCETDGRFVQVCTLCGYNATLQIDEGALALGHSWKYAHLDASCEEAEKYQIYCTVCGLIRWEMSVIGSEAAGHVKPENVKVICEPDCENAQILGWDCLECGAYIEETVGDALGHVIEVVVKEEATCTKTGLADHVCANCTALVEENVILPIERVCMAYETVISPATCTENGVREYRCKWCDQHLRFDTIPYGHTAGDAVTLINAACTENGLAHVYCTACGELLKEIILPVAGHVFSDLPALYTDACKGETIATVKCTICDYEELLDSVKKEVRHQRTYRYIAPDCEKSGTLEIYCTVCNEILQTINVTDDVALGHVYSQEQTVIEAPDCENTGSAAWICQRCTEIGEVTVLPALGHTPELKVIKEATCYADGEGQHICAACDTVLEEKVVLSKADKCEAKQEVLIASSCTADGLCQYVCKWCDRTIGYAILPANHEADDQLVIKASTCTQEGIAQTTCKFCGTIMVTSTLTKLEHIFEAGNSAKVLEATCTEGALMHYYCQVCNADGENKQDGLLSVNVGEALGHSWQEELHYSAADCTHAGRMVKKCTACGEEEIVTYDRNAPALGHNVLYKLIMPTCTEPMMVSGVCTVCGFEIERDNAQQIEGVSTAALGHTAPEEWQIVTSPNCQNTGLRIKHCTICGELMASEEMPIIPCEEQLECILQTADCRIKANNVSLMTCIWCNKVVRVQVEAYHHVYTENIVTLLEATCEDEGIELRTCALCGHEEQHTIAATGHITTDPYVLPADCENAERVVISCSICSEILHVEATLGDPLGHAFKVYEPELGANVCIYCHVVEP